MSVLYILTIVAYQLIAVALFDSESTNGIGFAWYLSIGIQLVAFALLVVTRQVSHLVDLVKRHSWGLIRLNFYTVAVLVSFFLAAYQSAEVGPVALLVRFEIPIMTLLICASSRSSIDLDQTMKMLFGMFAIAILAYPRLLSSLHAEEIFLISLAALAQAAMRKEYAGILKDGQSITPVIFLQQALSTVGLFVYFHVAGDFGTIGAALAKPVIVMSMLVAGGALVSARILQGMLVRKFDLLRFNIISLLAPVTVHALSVVFFETRFFLSDLLALVAFVPFFFALDRRQSISTEIRIVSPSDREGLEEIGGLRARVWDDAGRVPFSHWENGVALEDKDFAYPHAIIRDGEKLVASLRLDSYLNRDEIPVDFQDERLEGLSSKVLISSRLIVCPDEQGKGYGTALSRFALEYAERGGFEAILGNSTEKNLGIKRRIGYKLFNIHPKIGDYKNDAYRLTAVAFFPRRAGGESWLSMTCGPVVRVGPRIMGVLVSSCLAITLMFVGFF